MSERFYFDELHETSSVSQVFKSRPVRYALAFCAITLSASFLLTPQLVDPQSEMNRLAKNAVGAGVDPVTTGSIKKQPTNEYILRRSVLSRSANDICIIRRDGTHSGQC